MWPKLRSVPAQVLLRIVAALVLPTAVVAGFGVWLLLQDREIQEKRAVERLGATADLAAASFQRQISRVQDALADFSGPDELHRRSAATALTGSYDGALVALIAGKSLWTSRRLLFLPDTGGDFQDSASAVFSRAEQLEFAAQDLRAALAAYSALIPSPNARIQAGALARAARVAWKLHDYDGALRAYRRLGELGSVPAVGRPADLVAGVEECAVLNDMGDRDGLEHAARRVADRLARGAWRLGASEFRFYRDRLSPWARVTPTPADEALALGVQLVAAASAGRFGSTDRGMETFGAPESRGLLVWRRVNSGTAAFVATTAYVRDAWFAEIRSLEQSNRAHITITDPDGASWYGGAQPRSSAIRRTSAETASPFAIVVTPDEHNTDPDVLTRRRLLIGIVVVLGMTVALGGYATARGLARELAAARLQSDFVAAVSHEFRTPLASLLQLSEMLDDGRVADENRKRDYYRVLRRQSARLQKLVENLLDFGRMQSAATQYRFEPLDVSNLLREITTDFADEPSHSCRTVRLVVDGAVPVIHGDREALGRAIWNLLDNAAKYSPPPAAITVRAERVEGGTAIHVHDEGPGIPPADQQRIFEKFVRGSNARGTGSQGAGIGLAMVKDIVCAHRGSVSLASGPREGTTFTIVLPENNAA